MTGQHRRERQPAATPETARSAGYMDGLQFFAEYPDLDKYNLNKLADQEWSHGPATPLALSSYYREGFAAGYNRAKKESEVK